MIIENTRKILSDQMDIDIRIDICLRGEGGLGGGERVLKRYPSEFVCVIIEGLVTS